MNSIIPQSVELQLIAERIRLRMKRTAEDIIEIGRDLIAAKAKMGHGEFIEWLQDEFVMGQATAYNFIHVAERFGDDFTTVVNIAPKILYLLASPSMPDVIVEKVIAGDIEPNTTAIKEAKAAELQAKAEAENAQRQLTFIQSQQEQKQQEYDAAQERIKSLTRSIDAFQQEAQKPPIIKEVSDPKQLAKIQEQQQQIAQLTKEREDAIRRAAQLQQEAQRATEKYFAGENERRIRVQWSSNANRLVKLMREAITLLPPQSELYVFEPDDWAYVQEVKQTTRLFQEALAGLSQVTLSVIDAD